MSKFKLYIPRSESECSTAYGTLDRPETDLAMFYGSGNKTYAKAWVDHYTGSTVNFGQTLTGTDNKHSNITHAWRHTSGYARLGGYTKNDAYISWHIGAIPDLHAKSAILSYSQHLLPGYVGVRFQYRWPDTNDDNYWSNSPVHINDCMFHYYNKTADEIWSYAAGLHSVSTSNVDYYPDRFANNNGRRNDSWRGCYWKPVNGGARNEIRNNQLFMIGVSVEMKFSDRGTAKHSRCMDIRNFTPIWDKGGSQEFRPLLAKPKQYMWSQANGSRHELYMLS